MIPNAKILASAFLLSLFPPVRALAISVYPGTGGLSAFETGAGSYTGVALVTMDGLGWCSGSLL